MTTSTPNLARLGLVAIVAAALAVRLLIISQPIDALVAKVTPDDTYYYLQTARNIVHGEGASLDGMNEANGFHPLWLTLLLPFGVLDRSAMLYGALVLGAMIDVLTIPALYWATGPLSRRPAVRLVATAIYAFSPVTAFAVVSGMESSLSLLCLVTLFGLFLRCVTEETTPEGTWIWLGLVAGVAMLARTDNVLFVIPILTFTAFRRGIRPALQAGAVATLAALPWLAISTLVFGTPLQVSAQAAPVAVHVNFDPDGSRSLAETLVHGASLTKTAFLVDIPSDYFLSRSVVGAVAAAGVLGAAISIVLVPEARAIWRRGFPPLAVLVGGFVSMVVIHSSVRWFAREWYFLSAIPIASLIAACTLESIVAALRHADAGLPPWAYNAVLPAVVGLGLVGPQVYRGLDMWDEGAHGGLYSVQADILAAAYRLRESTPPDTRVAGLNTGILTYFSQRKTTNLDGVMNSEALDALKERKMLAYLDSIRPDYVADYETFLLGIYGRFWGGDVASRLEVVETFQQEGSIFGPYRIYRFR